MAKLLQKIFREIFCVYYKFRNNLWSLVLRTFYNYFPIFFVYNANFGSFALLLLVMNIFCTRQKFI
jgi:hypothetical protein